MSTLRRRTFLQALGLSSLVGTWPSTLSQANAAPADAAPEAVAAAMKRDAPLRFIGVFTPHGRAHELWQPGEAFDLRYPNCSLAPFDSPEEYGTSFKHRLLVLDGVDLTAGIEVGTVGHEASRVILTGSGADGKNASLDQFLAVDQGLGASTPHSSLVLGVGYEGSEIGVNVSYATGGIPVPKLIDPAKTFDELFGVALTGERRAALEARRARGLSVLDVLRKDLAAFSTNVPAHERRKLEQHTTALREIEKRLTRKPPNCALPQQPDARDFPKLKAFGGGERYFERITDLQVDLLARAIACDLTRFASLYLADLSRTGFDEALPIDVHSDVAHRYAASDRGGGGDPATWLPLARQNRHTYGKVARLMQRLEEAGVLDDTILYVSSDMGDPARHSSREVPTLIAGGSGGHFAMGRYVNLSKAGENQPNNRILVSICNAFGVPVSQFGHSANSTTTTGTLAELSG